MTDPRALSALSADIDTLLEELPWVHGHAWHKAGRDPDRGSPSMVEPPKPGQNPDQVPGEKHDIGIGVHRAREALALASRSIPRAIGLLDEALDRPGARSRAASRLDSYSGPDEFIRALRVLRRRVEILQDKERSKV